MEEVGTDVTFTFVDDERLRELLEHYYAEGKRAFEVESYLGALTACGAVLEGLLTWRLLKKPDAMTARRAQKRRDDLGKLYVPPLPEWGLAPLIAVAADLSLIGDTAEPASWAVQEFRNFVHPYNCLSRDSARPNRHLAESAFAAVGEIVRSLSGRLAK